MDEAFNSDQFRSTFHIFSSFKNMSEIRKAFRRGAKCFGGGADECALAALKHVDHIQVDTCTCAHVLMCLPSRRDPLRHESPPQTAPSPASIPLRLEERYRHKPLKRHMESFCPGTVLSSCDSDLFRAIRFTMALLSISSSATTKAPVLQSNHE